MNDEHKFWGWSFSIYGGLGSILMLSTASLVFETGTVDMRPPSTALIVFYGFILATFLLALLGGILLLKQYPFAHMVVLPATFFMMMSFPIGTIIGVVYLWRWFQDN